jgi:arylsulfatase A-like enzyme
VLNQLKAKHIEDNTIVVFLSDNGGPSGTSASNKPLRGEKSTYWDGGIRVPFAIQWPNKFKKGSVYDKPIISLDIMATITGYLKSKIDVKNTLDGVNLLPFLTSENKSYPHEYLFWRNFDNKSVAVRSETDKLVIDKKGENQLFNIVNDISESKNLIDSKKDKFDALLKQWKVWNQKMIDPKFIGLLKDGEYNKLNPDRFN